MKATACLLNLLLACSGSEKPKAAVVDWPVPAGWKSETIPFPLEFAPSIAHTGVEELRFPPGFFKAAAPDYWSYAFVWRTKDVAHLDANQLAAELTQYFRGLVVAVDEKKQQVKEPDRIVATARAMGDARFELTADVFDAFGAGNPVSLLGWAQRHDCGSGALWVFVLAPEQTGIRSQLDELANSASRSCPSS
jgi:hypothetical protein